MLLWFIREFISDGRLIRVLGQNGNPQYVPLTKKPDVAEYDLIVDQSPTSPDYREKTWEAMKEILPVMMKEGYPIPPSMLDFAPLPSNVAAEWKQMMAQRGQVPPQVQEQMAQMQKTIQQLGEENQTLTIKNSQLEVGAAVDILKIHSQHAQKQESNATKVYQTQIQALTERANALLEAHVKTLTAKMDKHMEAFTHVTQLAADLKAEKIKASRPAAKTT